jgi:hypothetical protein
MFTCQRAEYGSNDPTTASCQDNSHGHPLGQHRQRLAAL